MVVQNGDLLFTMEESVKNHHLFTNNRNGNHKEISGFPTISGSHRKLPTTMRFTDFLQPLT